MVVGNLHGYCKMVKEGERNWTLEKNTSLVSGDEVPKDQIIIVELIQRHGGFFRDVTNKKGRQPFIFTANDSFCAPI